MREEIALPKHGGDLPAVAATYGVDPASLTDFSANLNPIGPPAQVLAVLARLAENADALCAYPEPNGEPLRSAVAKRFGVDAAEVVVANGAAALIDSAVRAIAPAACVLAVPAFSEYRRALAACDVRTVAVDLPDDFGLPVDRLCDRIERERAGLLIVNNPHNPSGRLCTRLELETLIARCAASSTVVLLDEAFIDFVPEASMISRAFPNVVVIRSLTKFYAMAGLRIGYAVAMPKIARRMREMLPSWPVGTVEVQAAVAALGAFEYERDAIATNAAEREDLSLRLRKLGIVVYPSAANFLLLELPVRPVDLEGVLASLVIESGVVVRDCRSYEGLTNRSVVRVAVKSGTENARLIAAFMRVLSP